MVFLPIPWSPSGANCGGNSSQSKPNSNEPPSAIAAVAKENQPVRAQPSLEEFIRRLTESGLITEEEVREFLGGLPLEQHPAAADQLAGLMFQKGQLTRFQARMLYQGRTRGLVVGNYVILAPLGEGGMGEVYKVNISGWTGSS